MIEQAKQSDILVVNTQYFTLIQQVNRLFVYLAIALNTRQPD
ncbi:unnamed protein product, partial [Rotaria sordida]